MLMHATTWPGGLQVTQTWLYDTRYRLTAQVDPLLRTTSYEYDGFKLTKATSPSGIVSTWAYDTDGRLTQLVQASGSAQVLTTTYVYDNSDRRTKQTVDPNGLALGTEFYFDADGNLTRVKNPDGNFGPSWTFDAMERLSQEVWGTLTTDYSYDAASRLTKLSYSPKLCPLCANK